MVQRMTILVVPILQLGVTAAVGLALVARRGIKARKLRAAVDGRQGD